MPQRKPQKYYVIAD